MQWPWVKRSTSEAVDREHAALLIDLYRQVNEARGAREELKEALRRSEVERTDLQMSLLRVGFGYAPFTTPGQSDAPVSLPQDVQEPASLITPGMSDTEIQRAFTQEAMQMYGGNMRNIRDHVEKRQAEHYQYRQRNPIVSEAEMEAAAKVARDIEAAIEEGRVSAEKDN